MIPTLTPDLILPLVLTLLVAVIGTARLTRIVTYDKFPPMHKLRVWWVERSVRRGNGWEDLATCIWCMGPWLTLGCIVWFLVGWIWVPWLLVAWWVFYAWMAVSYLVSQYTFFDEGKS